MLSPQKQQNNLSFFSDKKTMMAWNGLKSHQPVSKVPQQ